MPPDLQRTHYKEKTIDMQACCLNILLKRKCALNSHCTNRLKNIGNIKWPIASNKIPSCMCGFQSQKVCLWLFLVCHWMCCLFLYMTCRDTTKIHIWYHLITFQHFVTRRRVRSFKRQKKHSPQWNAMNIRQELSEILFTLHTDNVLQNNHTET